MSREELVGAYVHGRMSRRVFIRSLVALGVATGAAVTYADSLASAAPARAGSAAPVTDLYPDDTTTTTTGATTTTASGTDAANAVQSTAATPVATDPSFTG